MEAIVLGASVVLAVFGYIKPVEHWESRRQNALAWGLVPLGLIVLALIVLSIIGDPLNFLSGGRY